MFKFFNLWKKPLLENELLNIIEVSKSEILKLESDLKSLGYENFLMKQALEEYQSVRSKFLENIIHIHYVSNYSSDLHKLCEKYGTDKGGNPSLPKPYAHRTHNYADYYETIFYARRLNKMNVLECGIGTNNLTIESNMGANGLPGASLRVWRDYFENSEIYGIDIDPDILIFENRIKSFQVDQTSKESIDKFLSTNKGLYFDIIIDDGLHTFEANKSLFKSTFPRLANTGIYVIEDVLTSQIPSYIQLCLEESVRAEIINLEAGNLAIGDNNLVVLHKT